MEVLSLTLHEADGEVLGDVSAINIQTFTAAYIFSVILYLTALLIGAIQGVNVQFAPNLIHLAMATAESSCLSSVLIYSEIIYRNIFVSIWTVEVA